MPSSDDARPDDARRSDAAILRLLVRNHPGVMSHVCSLFSRRAFNLEAIACLPMGDGARSLILLLVKEDDRLEQLILQLGKLQDVVEVEPAHHGRTEFEALCAYFGAMRA
jgi:acetolactate synthase-1/3 small subunit